MRRLAIVCAAGLLAGCHAPDGAERLAVPPVPAAGGPVTYDQALTRARLQATNATEAFYLDDWDSLGRSADSLGATARMLSAARDVPAGREAELPGSAVQLASLAKQLRRAADGRDIPGSTEQLQRIGLLIRNLRAPPPKSMKKK